MRSSSRSASPGNASPASHADASSKDESEFHIVIDRSNGGKLGVELELQGSDVKVSAVDEGLVKQWNASHAEAMVRRGDRFVYVNGVRGKVEHILAELQQDKLLEIIVQR